MLSDIFTLIMAVAFIAGVLFLAIAIIYGIVDYIRDIFRGEASIMEIVVAVVVLSLIVGLIKWLTEIF